MRRHEATWLRQVQSRGDGVRHAKVLVACSGGGDSTALLLFLASIRATLDLELLVAHADHGLRPESEADAAHVRDLCRHLDLDLVEAWLDVRGHAARSGQGLETAARDLRWAWLGTEAASWGGEVVATGHTLEDHTETVLLRLARGGGTGSLTPLPARQGLRWSPLIEARHGDLRTYLRALGVPWREDTSNHEGFTPRNRLRPILAPWRAEAPALDRHLWESHLQILELEDLRDRTVASWRGSRWNLEAGALRLAPDQSELELRWILHAALPVLGWPVAADLLRPLSRWLARGLALRSPRPRSWGGWGLEALPATGRDRPWRRLRRGNPIS
jgi:tRNA(Ile)-lysidine synthetase-like protein